LVHHSIEEVRVRQWIQGVSGALVFLVMSCSGKPAEETVPAPPVAGLVGHELEAAVSPLPPEYRGDATVLKRDSSGMTVVLREGKGEMICLAPDPAAKDFHAACYHKSLEPFMARGRELRAAGVIGDQVDSVRFREVQRGTLAMPKEPAALYQYFGGRYDPGKQAVVGAQSLYVVYIPFATGKSTGLSEKPSETGPWIMFPGTPKAHIMMTGKM
jgi:hypothetical protein